MVQTTPPSTEQSLHSNGNPFAGVEDTKAATSIPTGQDSSGKLCCVHCGTRIGISKLDHFSAGEIALNIVCGVVLVAVLVSAGYFINSLSEYAANHLFDHLFHHWVWDEPLDSWNL